MSGTTRRNIIWGSVPMVAMIAAYIFTAQSGATADTALAKRGEYIVNTAGCHRLPHALEDGREWT